jgi:hypothetical protein
MQRDAMDALSQSAVLGAWTAFECLASDLWCAAIDHGDYAVKDRVLKLLMTREIKDKADANVAVSIQNSAAHSLVPGLYPSAVCWVCKRLMITYSGML